VFDLKIPSPRSATRLTTSFRTQTHLQKRGQPSDAAAHFREATGSNGRTGRQREGAADKRDEWADERDRRAYERNRR
jgi:hypothetical protein